MKFFVPCHENDPQKAEEFHKGMRDFAASNLGWVVSDRRLFRIEYRHGPKELYAEVGQLDPVTGETVWAILESVTYLVCTTNRGALRGTPLLVGKNEAGLVQEFEM